ncbi:SART-1 family DOT2 [Chlorella sorokiniana]|uniref:SART-1 family DOT2 n=1 Tax=Chlorella sorokiniana TaxID=3076 RepID=A0A2P6U1Z3_CHLSO|nr:SART-1 family DOT2 [Chlorella sorokiniana]|eukprot:PRW60335.1 SART-1 family DOT2 [Chlorella sorokiniana]
MSGREERRGDGPEAGGTEQLSMSIEETNKMRVALGLKPLKMESEEPKGPTKAEQQREEEQKAAQAAELAAHVKQARERRQKQEELDRVKKLGESGGDVDDVMAWVNKSRQGEAQRKAEAAERQRRAAEERRRKEEEEEEDEYDEDMPTAAELAGAKVKHSAEELGEGETMILTLEDKGILDDKGNLVEEDDVVLENILTREDKERAKARKAAGKQAKPLWQEDGKRRGLLDKYDEEDEQMMELDDAGALEAARQKRQEEIRARLAAGIGGAAAPDSAVVAVQQTASDYYTQEEMAKFQKPKKKKERKLKKKALTEEELAALEAEAAARGTSDLGSRASREQRAADKAAAAAAADADRRARYEHALNKANYASLALRPESRADEDEGAGLDEDEDLYQSLNKARQLAQKTVETRGPENIAADLIKRREEQQKAQTAARLAGGDAADEGLVFTDVAEFARTIHVKEEPSGGGAPEGAAAAAAGAAAVKQEGAEEENYGLGEEAMETDQPAAAGGDNVWAGWVPASAGEGEATAAGMKEKLRAKHAGEGGSGEVKAEEKVKEEELVTREKQIGTGLAGALAFLKDRGELDGGIEWAGRTNDSKKVNVQGLEDVFTGGRQEDKLALDVEVALTRKDEYGRILTPKEAFRQLCYRFHGIQPSKNTRERRAKKAAEEVAKKRAASELGATAEKSSLQQMKEVQKQAAAPYVVLSGTIKPGQSRDAKSGYATVDKAEALTAPTPVLGKLGGGQTPLVGNAKVEAMLGIKRKGSESMPPPPPKAARQ